MNLGYFATKKVVFDKFPSGSDVLHKNRVLFIKKVGFDKFLTKIEIAIKLGYITKKKVTVRPWVF